MQVNDLPIYPEGRTLKVTDYHLIASILKDFPPEVSDINFTNIFAWRYAYEYKISRVDNTIVTSGIDDGKRFILPPIGDPKKIADAAYKALDQHRNEKERPFLVVSPDWLTKEMESMPNVKVVKDRADWDYVHKTRDLAELPGQKYHAKRNLVRQFTHNYAGQIEELNTETCKEAMEFSDRWCEQRDCESDEGLEKEKCAIYQMLTCFEALRLHGILVRVDEEIVGLAMGEELNPTTYVVHVEKGDQHLKGIYQYINQHLATRVAHKYEWINREQDLGIAGLRQAKNSYYPDHFVEKYVVELVTS